MEREFSDYVIIYLILLLGLNSEKKVLRRPLLIVFMSH